MTAVSAIVFFLGLLFGFQRPSRLLLPRLVCYRVSTSRLHPVQPRGLPSLFRSCSAVKRPLPLCFAAPSRLDSTWHRGALPLPVEGRGTYFVSASRVNSLRRLFLPPRFGFRRFEREAASTTAALGVNFAHRLFISSFTASTGRFNRRCGFAFPSEGRGYYHHRVGSQPPSSTLFFPPTWPRRRCGFRLVEGTRLLPPPRRESTPHCRLRIPSSSRPDHPTASAVSPSRPRGAASTTAALGVNTLLRLPLPGARHRGPIASFPQPFVHRSSMPYTTCHSGSLDERPENQALVPRPPG